MNSYVSKILTVVLAAVNIFSISAMETDDSIHNFASYNIRYTNAQENGVEVDTGEKNWAVRGTYVMQIVKDYDFDMFGMQEVTGRSGKFSVNPATNTSQLEDLQAELSDYTLLTYERDGAAANKDYSYNVIGYKKDKYECLSEGCFWISSTPDQPSNGWDPDYTIRRTCAWAKMKVKSTGEIFFFAVAHCNYGPSLDGPNGGHLVASRLSEMAGELPVILVGDFNMRRNDHKEAYREYAAVFNDAALIAETSGCLPEENGTTTITAHNWNLITSPQFSGSEFDFGFCRAMEVKDRYIITENYGRSIYPSDHFPILMRCSFSNRKDIYVDKNVSDNGDGSIMSPYNNLNSATQHAKAGDVVYVTANVYKEAVNMNTSLKIEGGYDAQFQEIVGKTILDGDVNGDDASGLTGDNLSNLLLVNNHASLDLSNFIIQHAVSANRTTDGALVCSGADLALYKVDILNNTGSVAGAGLLAHCRDIELQQCKVGGNSIDGTGAGALIYATGKAVFNNCLFENNSAKAGAALFVVDAKGMRISNSTFCNNLSLQYGTVYFPANKSDAQYGPLSFSKSNYADNISLWNNTFANNRLTSPSGLPTVTKKFGGSAIYAQFADASPALNIAHNTFTGNIATFAGSNKSNYGGSAISAYGGNLCMMNNIIAGNYNEGDYADLYVDATTTVSKEQYNVFSAAATANIALSEKDFTAGSYEAAVTAIATTLDGSVTEGKFVANLTDNGGFTPTVKAISQEFAGTRIGVLTAFLRYIESSFNIDIDGDGKVSGALKTDQRGEDRASSSMPGACEYIGSSKVETVVSGKNDITLIALAGNKFQLKHDNGNTLGNICVFNMAGYTVINTVMDESETVLDLSQLPNAIYLITVGDSCHKVVIR